MGEKKIETSPPTKSSSKYLTLTQFRREIMNWSDDTIRRRVREDDLPALHDGTRMIFERAKVEAWFKRRLVKAE